MKSVCAAAVVVIALCAGVAGAQPQSAPEEPRPVVSAPAPKLSAAEVLRWPLSWPDEVALTEDMQGDGGVLRAGTVMRLNGVERDGVVCELAGGELTIFPVEATDLLDRANAINAKLPEDARKLTFRDLLTRTDLLPAGVRLVEDVTFPDKVRAKGAEIGPYAAVQAGRDVQLRAVDPEMVKKGELTNRQLYQISQTDLRQRLRDRMLESGRSSRLLEELKDRLVDSMGSVVAPAPAKFYAVYGSAAWCGWCTRFNPELSQFHAEVVEKGLPVQVIYLSQDRSEADMLAHLSKAGIAYPAVKFDERINTPFVTGLVSGGTPHLVIVDAQGRTVHDGMPAGMNGAQAALRKLRQELAKK
jgi:thiol-disulfide isomerase/thioredoxin